MVWILALWGCSAVVEPEITVAPEVVVAESPPFDTNATRVVARDLLLTQGGLFAGVSSFRGQISATTEGVVPFLDDPKSWKIYIEDGEVVLPSQTLAQMLATQDDLADQNKLDRKAARKAHEELPDKVKPAPFRSMEITTRGDLLVFHGKARFLGLDIELEARPFVTKGRLGLDITKVFAAGVDLGGGLGGLGIHLDDIVDVAAEPAIEIVENTIVVDIFRFVVEPRIEATITGVKVVPDGVLITVGSPGADPVESEAGSAKEALAENLGPAVTLRGGTTRFGNSTLHGVDMTIHDQDPSDPLLISAGGFQKQMMIGYVKIQMDGGMDINLPDWDQLDEALVPGVAAPVKTP